MSKIHKFFSLVLPFPSLFFSVLIFISLHSYGQSIVLDETTEQNLYKALAELQYGSDPLEVKLEKLTDLETNLKLDYEDLLPSKIISDPSMTVGKFLTDNLISSYVLETLRATSRRISTKARKQARSTSKEIESLLVKLNQMLPKYFGDRINEIKVSTRCTFRKNRASCREAPLGDLVAKGNNSNINKLFTKGKLASFLQNPILIQGAIENNKVISSEAQSDDINNDKIKCQLQALDNWKELELKLLKNIRRKNSFTVVDHFISNEEIDLQNMPACTFSRLIFKSQLRKPNKDVKVELVEGFFYDESSEGRMITTQEFSDLIGEIKKLNKSTKSSKGRSLASPVFKDSTNIKESDSSKSSKEQ